MFFRRSTAVVLMALSVAFLGLVSVSAAPVAGTDLTALGNDFKALRQVQGHWDGQEFNKDVDAFDGKKHQVMKQLHEALSMSGTKASLVEETMGPSDDIPAEILKQLKRSEPQITPPTNFKYALYKWRGYHDYLWFRINLRTKTVSKSEWYFAYE